MTAHCTPLRSLLFVPGNRADRFAKALDSDADAVVFDLEASVPAAQVPAARQLVRDQICQVAASGSRHPALFVRVGAADSADVHLDIDAVCVPGLRGVLVPNVLGPPDIEVVDDLLTAAEAKARLPAGSVVIVPGLETAQSIRQAYEVASASRRVAYLGGGTSDQGDLGRELGFQWTAEGFETLFIRSKVLLDARAAGIEFPVTGVWGDIENIDGFRAFCVQSRRLGYRGVIVIHPSHVEIANEVFEPTRAEVIHWREVIELMTDLQARGVGAGRLSGQLIDEASIKTARDGLAWAWALGIEDASEPASVATRGSETAESGAEMSMIVRTRSGVADRVTGGPDGIS
jgi:citrate lyase subunit beta / citryl-CoA lyase